MTAADEGAVWIKTEPTVDGEAYVVTLEASDDVAVTLTPTTAARYALSILDAAHRAAYDAAVLRQLTSTGIAYWHMRRSPMTKLVLERKDQADESLKAPGLMMTPNLDEDYWTYRVRLTDTQAVLGFPKFTTIGIGFAQEEDWNTNLPYQAEARQILAHIIHNKGDDSISDEDVLAAIKLIQQAAIKDQR